MDNYFQSFVEISYFEVTPELSFEELEEFCAVDGFAVPFRLPEGAQSLYGVHYLSGGNSQMVHYVDSGGLLLRLFKEDSVTFYYFEYPLSDFSSSLVELDGGKVPLSQWSPSSKLQQIGSSSFVAAEQLLLLRKRKIHEASGDDLHRQRVFSFSSYNELLKDYLHSVELNRALRFQHL